MGADHGGYMDYLEKPVAILLRNNRYLYGTLKSYDQYNCVVLDHAIERVFHEGSYSEQKHGFIVLRGESIMLIGTGKPVDLKGLKKMDHDALMQEIEKNRP